jgi:hypothetical protein
MTSELKRRGRGVASVVCALAIGATAAFGQQPSPADRKAAAEAAAQAAQAKIREAAALPAPRAADGHPDLSGYWATVGGYFPFSKPPSPVAGPAAPGAPKEIQVFPPGASVAAVNAGDRANSAARRADPSLRPKYKPEYVAKTAEFFEKGDLADPTYGCQLPGVVRLGTTSEIFQRPGAVVLLYEGLVNRFRVIPVDGRKRELNEEALPLGHPLGRWDGDTLVIETSGFVPDYWLDKDGSFYSDALKLTERLTRQGNTLNYQLMAEDSKLFVEPFKPKPTTLLLQPAARHIDDEYGCDERDIQHMVNGTKH